MPEKKSILLRIPVELWEQLNRLAQDDLRSMNAQIEYMLRDAVRRRMGGGGAATAEGRSDGDSQGRIKRG